MNVRTETAIQNAIRMVLSKVGLRLFRNNIGLATFPDGSKVEYGLGPGTSDLIGWKPVTVTQDMVGKRLAVFVAVEVKKPGHKTSKERLEQQLNFLHRVVEAGGIGVMCDDETKAAQLVEQSFTGKAVAVTLNN